MYTKANTDWLASRTIGFGVHWTAQTAPRHGVPCNFQEAVNRFRLNDFLDAVDASGARYVLFTTAHALQMLPCPHPVLDEILPGRTAERDLIGELADGLKARDKKLILYYNHSCNQADDPAWEQAVGYRDQPKNRLAENLCAIVHWLGSAYGNRVHAWWFDSPYSLDPRGPYNSVSTDMGDFRFPWEKMTRAAKAGFSDRLVTYNAGVGRTFLYTDHQDYWAGELTDLDTPPRARYLDNGLQWHGFTCLDDPRWVYSDNSRPLQRLPYSDDRVARFLAACRRHGAAMTFNVTAFQDGTLREDSIRQLQRVTKTSI